MSPAAGRHGGLVRPALVASDLDGTLLRTDGSASPRTVAVLRAVQEAGIATVLVTARPPRWLDDLADLVGDGGVALCGNGAFVYDVVRRRIVAHHGIEADVVAEVIADLRRELPGIVFAAERVSGFTLETGYPSQHPVPHDAVHGPVEHGTEPVGKLLGRHSGLSDEQLQEAVTRVVGGRGIVAYSGAGGLAEITAPGVTKAAALAEWCAGLGVEAARVWAFGDMPNDLPMLAWAGTAFAVRNAHPAVLEAADHVVPSNDEDGVARQLETLVEHIVQA